MDTDVPHTESIETEPPVPGKSSRPPPIVLTSTITLIQLQKQRKGISKQQFEFHNTRNRTRITTKDMVDYKSVKGHLEFNNLSFYTFYLKSERPIRAVTRHLPINTPAKDIAEGLVDLGFEIISVKQVSTTRRSPKGTTPTTLPLFLITLPRMTKSQDLFKLSNVCHISIKVESYKSQNALTQCYNCQKFGHVRINCKQPPRCLWCGGSYIHKECPEKGNTASTPTCCNWQLAEGEAVLPANYRGCKHAKEEIHKRKIQGTPNNTEGRVFSSKFVKSNFSFATAVRDQTDSMTHQDTATTLGVPENPTPKQQEPGQPIPAPIVSYENVDMYKVITVVQQIMKELNDAVPERDKIFAVTNIVFNLLKQNGQ
jgi:hypothetical protein